MSNARFCYFNLLTQPETEIEVTFGGENPFYPASNLKHPHALKSYRTASGGVAIVVFDFQTPATADTFLAVGNYYRTLDLESVVIEANATDEWSSPAFTTTVLDFDYEADFASLFFEAQTFRYWRLTLTGPTDDYLEVGKLFLGAKVELASNNIAIGFEHGAQDLSTVVKGRYGQRFVDVVTDLKTFKASIGLMTIDEQDTIRAMYDYCGKSQPFWLVPDPDEAIISNKDALSGYYYFVERPSFKNDFFGLYSTEFVLEEAK